MSKKITQALKRAVGKYVVVSNAAWADSDVKGVAVHVAGKMEIEEHFDGPRYFVNIGHVVGIASNITFTADMVDQIIPKAVETPSFRIHLK